ncbi:MAG TPA: M1 family aminopeptidase [Longimicrobium sp.]|nr:M1 family aminopeptidase [Longimicrobium sp.]
MTAFAQLARFTLRHQLRRISTWVYFAVFFLSSFMITAAAGGAFAGFDLGDTVLLANSPLVVVRWAALLSLLAVPVTAALAGNAAQADFQARIHPLLFTTPVSRAAYLGGRYAGAVAANAVVLLGIPLGMAAAAAMPFLDPGRLGPFRADAFAFALLVFIVPNLLFTSAVFLVMSALTRRSLPHQVGGIGLLLAYSVASAFTEALEFDWVMHLADPFGMAPLGWATRYWTVAEQNTLALPLTGPLLLNRLLWLGVGAAVLAYGLARFRFAQFASEDLGRAPPAPAEAPSLGARLHLPRPRLAFGPRARLAQYAAYTRESVRRVARGVWFWVLAGMALVVVLLSAVDIGAIYGTRTYPVTYQVVEAVGSSLMLFMVLILAVYAGELVWDEREAGSAQIHDALPVPGWVPFAAKVTALVALCAALLAVGTGAGMLIQAARGYFRFEPGLYLAELFGFGLAFFALVAVFAVTVQSLANHKYMGHLLVVGYWVAVPLLYLWLPPHNLLFFPSTPSTFYSDMNGYGHTLRGWAWYTLFWALVAVLMAVAATVFWPRGMEGGARGRLRLARARLTRPTLAAAGLAGALVLATGGFILHNTVALNDFETEEEGARVTAEYEKRYKRYQHVPQPRITRVRLEVDIHPGRRDVDLRGAYTLVNRTRAAIRDVHVDLLNTLEIRRMGFAAPARRIIADRRRGYYAFRLARPLAPGDSTELRFHVAHVTRGFENEPSFWPVVGNGTFFSSEYLPGIGYNPEGELQDAVDRERHGLPDRPRATPIGDPRGRMRNFVSRDADWIDFAVMVSTSADQVALAPGYLTREWRRGGRRYFRYEMDVPMLNFYAFLSARYAVRRDRWKDVAIEVFHHPGHEYNVDRMVRAVKASLDYYTREFGPYQHRQVRILEFPRYAPFAQSFANTIPYSEGIGFIADVGADDIDYPYFVTAHEVAHQWWGHQVVPADVQGGAMLSETLSEYSALMVMEKEYGRAQIGRFLRHELDEYLKGRTAERRAEMPLSLVENQQYIHYNKGALAMYALRDYAGEAAVNGALRAFLDEARYRAAPYPTSRDLLRHLRAAVPDTLQALVEDLFETVTLWDLSATRAQGRELPDGRYQVEFTVEAAKLRAGELGDEEAVDIDDVIEVGVFGADPEEPLWLRRARFTGAPRTFRVVLDERPRRAGIDPLHKLIDRDLDDNVKAVTRAPRTAVRRGG